MIKKSVNIYRYSKKEFGLLYTILALLPSILGILFAPYYLRVFSKDIIGLYGYYMAFQALVMSVARYGGQQYLFANFKNPGVLNYLVVFNILLALILLPVGGLIAVLFDRRDVSIILLVLLLGFSQIIEGLYFLHTRLINAVYRFSVLTVIGPLMVPIIVYISIQLFGASLYSRVLGPLVSSLIVIIIVGRRIVKDKLFQVFFKDHLNYGYKYIASSLPANLIRFFLFSLIITRLGVDTGADWQVATTLGYGIPLMLTSAVITGLNSYIISKKDNMKHLWRLIIWSLVLLPIPLMIVLNFTEDLIKLYAGDNYNSAVYMLNFFLIHASIRFIGSMLYQFSVVRDTIHGFWKLELILAVIMLIYCMSYVNIASILWSLFVYELIKVILYAKSLL